jgi:hypothetical protein
MNNLDTLEKIDNDVQERYVPKGCKLKNFNKIGVYFYDETEKVQFLSYYDIKLQKRPAYEQRNG